MAATNVQQMMLGFVTKVVDERVGAAVDKRLNELFGAVGDSKPVAAQSKPARGKREWSQADRKAVSERMRAWHAARAKANGTGATKAKARVSTPKPARKATKPRKRGRKGK